MASVDPAVWRRTKELFLAALDMQPGQRGAFLAAAWARPSSPRLQALVKAAGQP
jgi:hypothetical protein